MRQCAFYIFSLFCILIPNKAFSIGLLPVGCLCTGTEIPYTHSTAGCTTTSKVCANQIAYTSCTKCNSGYHQVSHNISNSNCVYYTCEKDAVECKECPNCENTNWVNSSTGYQSRNVRTCNYTTCVCNPQIQIEFRCAAGYYGTAAAGGTSGCTRCPSSGNSAAGNNSTITKCYLSNWTSSDSTGYYTCTGTTYYQN